MAEAKVARRRGVSIVWLVPAVALLLGIWMIYATERDRGPEVTMIFSTAEGVEAGKTRIKARNVDVGLVTGVRLGDDLESVVVEAELEHSAAPLLREDTQFWVVRPRVGIGGISGIGTLVSGGYIELAPGQGEPGRTRFVGLDEPPVTPVGTPGLKFQLVGEDAGSLGAGDTILYRGFPVGRVESARFDVEEQRVRYDAFIEEPYDALVTENTRFWNVSGVAFNASADGIELTTGSLQSLLLGVLAFGVPRGRRSGGRVDDGAEFRLYPDEKSVEERPYRQSIEYVIQFARSVRGLRPGAPVEYRGLPAGRVDRIMLDEMVRSGRDDDQAAPIPVLIVLEPGRLAFGDDEEGRERLREAVEAGVASGLRATLASGNLLTGSLLVALDAYPDAAPAQLGTFAGRPTIPTVASGLEGLQQQLSTLLDRVNDLPVEELLSSADGAVRELEATIAELRGLASSEGLRSLPGAVEATLAEADRTLRRLQELAARVEAQPSSLLFSAEPGPDPAPQAGAP